MRINPKPGHTKVAAVVVVRNNTALILQRGHTAPWEPGKWNLPGGTVDEGESVLHAAVRETLEETGIDLYCMLNYDPDNTGLFSLGVVHYDNWSLETFVAEITDPLVLPEDAPDRASLLPISEELGFPESIDYRWITYQEIDQFEYVPEVKKVLDVTLSGSLYRERVSTPSSSLESFIQKPRDWPPAIHGEWGESPVLYTHRVSRNQDLAGEDLQDAVLIGSDLRGSSFRGANLQGASLYKCDLRDCDFTGANLDGANLTFATVDDAIFDECSMRNTLLFDPYKLSTVEVFKPTENGLHIFGFVDEPEIMADEPDMLRHLRQSGEISQYLELICGLSGSDVAPPAINPKFVEKLVIPGEGDAPVLSVIMVQPASSPDYINLSGMDLSGADFTSCFGNRPDEKMRFVIRHGDLRYTDLSGADLTMAVFYKSNFSHANLSGADLSGTAFQESDLSKANLSSAFGEASVWDSTLRGADLRGLDKDSILYSDWHNVDFKGATADNYRLWSKSLREPQLRQLFPEM